MTTETAIGPVSGDGNGETARSIGAELTGTFRPLRGLSIIGNLAYNDAELTADLPEGNGGFDGDRLPYAPKWTANLSADYEWRAFGDGIAFVGGSVRMIDDQETDFDLAFRTAFGRRLVIDNYESVDLRAGFEVGAVTATFFAKNLFNSRGLTDAGGFGTRPGTAVAVSPIRPRTLGVTAGFTF